MINKILCTTLAGAMLMTSGCSLVNGSITPSATTSSDIQTAWAAICSPAGLLAAAQPFANTPPVSTYYGEAQTICANGAPTNVIVAGLDIFDVYLDLSAALSKRGVVSKAVVAHARALKAKAKHA